MGVVKTVRKAYNTAVKTGTSIVKNNIPVRNKFAYHTLKYVGRKVGGFHKQMGHLSGDIPGDRRPPPRRHQPNNPHDPHNPNIPWVPIDRHPNKPNKPVLKRKKRFLGSWKYRYKFRKYY